MTSEKLTSISTPLAGESYPQRRLRFSQSEVFARLVAFLCAQETPLGLDSIETDLAAQSGASLQTLPTDLATTEDVDFFLSTLGDRKMPGAGTVRTFISEDGHLQIEAFRSHGLYVHVIDGDAVVVCVSSHAGAVQKHWEESFERCGVPTAICRY